MGGRCAMNKPIRIEPAKGAARMMPNPSGPTLKISLAKTGSMATAPPKSTANISSDNAPSITWFLKTNRNPAVRLSIIESIFSEGGKGLPLIDENKITASIMSAATVAYAGMIPANP